jgi:hypothetical protein
MGVGYVLDQSARIAYRIKMAEPPIVRAGAAVQAAQGAQAAQAARAASASSQSIVTPQGVEMKNESLGTRMIEGIEATGRRVIMVYPVNYDGNDRPITSTNDTWYAPALGITVLTQRNDPRSGETTTKHTNISLVNPDPDLFLPPADFQIVDVEGPRVMIRMN